MFAASDTVLFFDDDAIARAVRLSRVFEQPTKYGEVLGPDRPWEHECVCANGCVLPAEEGNGYRMWYHTAALRLRSPWKSVLCYAESRDGVHWTKPDLGLYKCEGGRGTNIVLMAPGMDWYGTSTVIHDEHEPDSARRYKCLTCAHFNGTGLYVAFSPDGIHWDVREEPVTIDVSDRTTLLHAPGLERPFVAFSRKSEENNATFRRRIIWRLDSPDLFHWSKPEPMLEPELEDSWDLQFYGMHAFKYRDQYLGVVQRLWTTPDVIDTELVSSHDTVTWNRSRTIFLPRGPEGAWDSRWVCPFPSAPVDIGDTLHFFFEGRNGAHQKVWPGLYPHRRGAIGCAVMPKDRLVALEAGPVEGYIETKPFEWPGGALRLNVNARIAAGEGDHHIGAGSAWVEVIDDSGTPVPGYLSETLRGASEGSWEPRWQDNASMDALAGRTIVLRVYLCQARLYGLHCTARK